MKPSPGILPQQTLIERLHAAEPAAPASTDPDADMVDRGQVANVQTVEKTIIGKIIDALRGVKP